MRKSFALCEGFRLTLFRAKPPDPTGALPIRARDHVRGAQPRGSPPGLDDQAADTTFSGGEALRSLHCAARSAVQLSLRAAARGPGVGVEDDHRRSACSRGAAVKLYVEITSRS